MSLHVHRRLASRKLPVLHSGFWQPCWLWNHAPFSPTQQPSGLCAWGPAFLRQVTPAVLPATEDLIFKNRIRCFLGFPFSNCYLGLCEGSGCSTMVQGPGRPYDEYVDQADSCLKCLGTHIKRRKCRNPLPSNEMIIPQRERGDTRETKLLDLR